MGFIMRWLNEDGGGGGWWSLVCICCHQICSVLPSTGPVNPSLCINTGAVLHWTTGLPSDHSGPE